MLKVQVHLKSSTSPTRPSKRGTLGALLKAEPQPELVNSGQGRLPMARPHPTGSAVSYLTSRSTTLLRTLATPGTLKIWPCRNKS
jgi:hypothetical protein